MRRRISYRPWIFLGVSLIFLFALPSSSVQSIRKGGTHSVMLGFNSMNWLGKLFTFHAKDHKEEILQLVLENKDLKKQIETLTEQLAFERSLAEQIEKLRTLSTLQIEDNYWKEFFRRRSLELTAKIHLQLQALPANVIYRDPSSWSSSLWIDIGEDDNRFLGASIVMKNSPVIQGTSIVGVVEEVEKKRSRIRLISDHALKLSVRAIRGEKQNPSSLHLAKGELCGSCSSKYRNRSSLLRGVGFNYDFSDEESLARDLRTGSLATSSKELLLQIGDLLVTTGMDGIFPAGFEVAMITKIDPLQEGATFYTLEAQPTAQQLDHLKAVWVLPPLLFDNP